jgi:hypothetical protein
MELLSCCTASTSRTKAGAWEPAVREEGGHESKDNDVDIGVLAKLQQVARPCIGCLAIVGGNVVLTTGLEDIVRACR